MGDEKAIENGPKNANLHFKGCGQNTDFELISSNEKPLIQKKISPKSNSVQIESENEQLESVKLVNIDDLLRDESSNDKNDLDEYKHWIKPITILHKDSTIQSSIPK